MRLHASAIALGGRGALIKGAAGSGKSSLALELMAFGAALVADDQVEIVVEDGQPVAAAPATLPAAIEARGVGLLAAERVGRAPVELVIDLDTVETERLPPDRTTTLLGCRVPLLHKSESTHFAAAILQYLKAGKAGL